MSVNVVEFPVSNLVDIPTALRNLASSIERGEHGDAHNLVWVIDMGNGSISVGLFGVSASPGAEAHLLCALAQRHLESSHMEGI